MHMKLFSRFRRKKQKAEGDQEELLEGGQRESIALSDPMEDYRKDAWGRAKENIALSDPEECKEFIRTSCDTILELRRLRQEAKTEYSAVTDYLSDIQTIANADAKQAATIENTSRQIVHLNKEIEKYRGRDGRLTPSQYLKMEKYADEIPKEIRKLEENEDFFRKIKSDLRYLEEEKEKIGKRQKNLYAQQKYLKRISVVIGILLVCLFGVFIGLSAAFHTDMTIPYLVTIALAAAGILYIFLEAGKNQRGMKKNQREKARAITLINRVKIKYINTSNLLDYLYQKFQVESADMLRYQYEEYLKAKQAERMFRDNTEKLLDYQQKLSVCMKKLGVRDCEIWGFQAEALVDPKEMVELRHQLNVRRQKLRVQMEQQEKLQQNSRRDVQELLEKKPEYKEELIRIMKEYGIETG